MATLAELYARAAANKQLLADLALQQTVTDQLTTASVLTSKFGSAGTLAGGVGAGKNASSLLNSDEDTQQKGKLLS